MPVDFNEIKLTDTIDKLRKVPTRSGTKMVELLLPVREEKFWVIAFKDVAMAILSKRKDGDRVSVTGTAGINSWKDDQEH